MASGTRLREGTERWAGWLIDTSPWMGIGDASIAAMLLALLYCVTSRRSPARTATARGERSAGCGDSVFYIHRDGAIYCQPLCPLQCRHDRDQLRVLPPQDRRSAQAA